MSKQYTIVHIPTGTYLYHDVACLDDSVLLYTKQEIDNLPQMFKQEISEKFSEVELKVAIKLLEDLLRDKVVLEYFALPFTYSDLSEFLVSEITG